MDSTIKNKKSNFLSCISEEVSFVFHSDFSVAAGFSVLLFFLVSAWLFFDVYFWRVENLVIEFKNLSFSCFTSFLGSSTVIFFFRNKSKKFIHIVAAIFGVVSFGIARLLIFTETSIPVYCWGFVLFLLIVFMFAVYFRDRKFKSLLFVFSKFIKSVIIAHLVFVMLFLCVFLFFECVINNLAKNADVAIDIMNSYGLSICISYVFSLCIVGTFYFFSSMKDF